MDLLYFSIDEVGPNLPRRETPQKTMIQERMLAEIGPLKEVT